MAWQKKKAGGVTAWEIDAVPIAEASAFASKKAKAKWFIHSVCADGAGRVVITSCKTTYPPKSKPAAEAE